MRDTAEKLTFLGSEYPDSSPEEARFHVIPVPLEQTVSYGGGTDKGPRAILEASNQLEAWDGKSAPCSLGVYTHPAIDCDKELPEIFEDLIAAVRRAVRLGAIPVTLGGEHTVSYGPIKALTLEGKKFGVLHFDAHADLRDVYEESPFSHACVLHRVVEDCGTPLVQFGTRDYCRYEAAYRKEKGILAYDGPYLEKHGLPENPLPEDFPADVYVTFDVDGFDSSLMPATGTPSPGGLFWRDAIHILEVCLKGRRLIGLDVVELAPIPGLHHCDFTTAKLTHYLMGMAQRSLGLPDGEIPLEESEEL